MFRAFLLATIVAFASAYNTPLAASRMVSTRAVAMKPTLIVMSDIEDKVKAIIAEQLGVDAAKVTPDASFTEDLGADSLDAVEVRAPAAWKCMAVGAMPLPCCCMLCHCLACMSLVLVPVPHHDCAPLFSSTALPCAAHHGHGGGVRRRDPG